MLPVPYFEQKKVISLFAIVAYLGLILLGLSLLYALRGLIPPFLVAAIIAMTLRPEVDRMERRGRLLGMKITRGIAITVIYVLFLCAFAASLTFLIPLVSAQMTGLITEHVPNEFLHGSPEDVTALATRWMNRWHVPTSMRPPVLNQAQHVPQLLENGLQWFSANLPALAQNLVWVVVVPILAFFILLDFYKIVGKLLIMLPRQRREEILTVTVEVSAVFGNYVRGVLLVMLLDIVVIAIVLWAFGLREYALTLAVTAGILYTIPYLGAVVSTLGIGLITLATHGPWAALWVTLVMILIHQVIFDNIVAPRIIGGSVNLHPLLALIALMAGGTLFGIGGTLLAVPLAAAAQVVLVHLFPQLKADVVARRLEPVVRASLDQETEEEKPEMRKTGEEKTLQAEAAAAREAAQEPPPVLPTAKSEN